MIIRPVRREEFAEFVRVLELSAGRRLTPEALTDGVEAYPLDRTLALVDEGTIVGGTASDHLGLTVPGPVTMPVTRVTLTATLPTHRGHGHVSQLLTAQARDLSARGEVLLVASTSTPGLVERVGYGAAASAVQIEVQTGTALLDARGPADHGRIRFSDPPDYALLADVFAQHCRQRPGQIHRSEQFWRLWGMDRPLYRIGEGERFVVIRENQQGHLDGYLTYRLSAGSLREQPIERLVVEDLIALTDAASRALWRYCLTFTQARLVQAPNASCDEPVRWMLADPRRLRVVGMHDFLWLRILDVTAVLAARRYGTDGDLTIRVRDAQIAANNGSFRLVAGATQTTCAPTDEPGELELDIRDLAAVYLGGTPVSTLHRAGRITELVAGAVARADALFASQPAPWTVTDW